MSAGSAFASGVRAGQNIWNQAINNAMAGKRMDMLKTQFQFEQRQRKQAIDNQVSSENVYDKFVEYLPTAVSSGEINFSTPEGRENYASLKSSVEPTISRDPNTWRRYEAFSKTFEQKEGYPVFLEEERNRLLTVENYKTVSGENDPLYKRNEDGSFILNPDGKPQLDMPSMNNVIDDYKLEKEVEAIKKKQDALYGSGGLSTFFGSKPGDVSPEIRNAYIINRNKHFNAVVKTGDNEAIVKESYVWTGAPNQSDSQSLDKYKFTIDRLGELQEMLSGEETGPIIGTLRSANPWDKKASLIKAQLAKIVPSLARGVFNEVGVLTEPDIENYSKTIGNLTAPEEVNEALTDMAIKMVSGGLEEKLSTLAKSRINVSQYHDTLLRVKEATSRLLGEEEEIPLIEANSYEVVIGQPSFSAEDYEKIKQLGASQFRIIDEGGQERIINIPQENVSTPPPAPKPNTMDFLEELWPGSVNPQQEEAKEESKPAPSSDEIDKKLDRKLKIERRINVLQEQLDKLPSPPPSTRSRRSSYVPVYTNTKADRDTEKKRKQLIESIKKNKENLSKL